MKNTMIWLLLAAMAPAGAVTLDDLRIRAELGSPFSGDALGETPATVSIEVINLGTDGEGEVIGVTVVSGPTPVSLNSVGSFLAAGDITLPAPGPEPVSFSLPIEGTVPGGLNWYEVCARFIEAFDDERCFTRSAALTGPTLQRTSAFGDIQSRGSFGRTDPVIPYRGVAVVGDRAYLKTRGFESSGELPQLVVYDVSDLLRTEASEERPPLAVVPTAVGASGGIVKRNGRLYAFGGGGIEIFNLANADAPESLGMATSSRTGYLAFDGDRAIRTDDATTTDLFTVDGEGNLNLISTIARGGTAAGLSGDLAFVSTLGSDPDFGFVTGEGFGILVQPLAGGIPAGDPVFTPTGFVGYHVDLIDGQMSVTTDFGQLVFTLEDDLTLSNPVVKASGSFARGRNRVRGPDGTVFNSGFVARVAEPAAFVGAFGPAVSGTDGAPYFSDIEGNRIYLQGFGSVDVFELPQQFPVDFHIPATSELPTVDGIIDIAEWDFAATKDISLGGAPAPFYMAHGNRSLWFASDHQGDAVLSALDQFNIYFDDEGGGQPPFLNDEAWTATDCADSDEGEQSILAFDDTATTTFRQTYIVGAIGCGEEFGFPIGDGAATDAAGNTQFEGFFSLTDSLLDAQTGNIFGLFVGIFEGEGFSYLGANIDPAFRREPAALPFARLDSLRSADVVIPTTVEVLAGTSLFPPENLINDSGLDMGHFGRHRGFDNENWVTVEAFPDYFAGGLPAPVLLFDLGQDVELDGLLLWQYSFNSGSGAPQGNASRDIRLQFATDADGPEGINEDLSFAEYIVAGPPLGGIGPNNFRERHPFSRWVTARYVRVTILSNYADQPGFEGGDRVGLGEIAFLTGNLLFFSSFEADEGR